MQQNFKVWASNYFVLVHIIIQSVIILIDTIISGWSALANGCRLQASVYLCPPASVPLPNMDAGSLFTFILVYMIYNIAHLRCSSSMLQQVYIVHIRMYRTDSRMSSSSLLVSVCNNYAIRPATCVCRGALHFLVAWLKLLHADPKSTC